MRDNRLLLLLAVAGAVSVFLGLLLGSTPMSPVRIFAGLTSTGDTADQIVVWQIRLPRILAAFSVGAALGASGAALQGLLRNPLAEPGVLGVSATAALGATFTIYYGLVGLTAWMLPLGAILGALTATAVLALAAIKTRSVVTLILIGVGLSSFASAVMSLLMNLAPNPFSLSDMVNWMLGSVANRSLEDLALTAPFILLGLGLLFINRRGLSILTLGEEAAEGAGLNLRHLRLAIVIGTGVATGASVALAGAIGFVGIVAPHLVRPFVNHDPARSLLPSALLSGIILILADIGVRLIPSPNEMKLGVLAALIGAPAFIYIAMQRRGQNG